MMQGRPITEKQRETMIKALASGASVTAACRRAKVSRCAFYSIKRNDKAFAEAVDDAIESGTDVLEDAAMRFAKAGDAKLITFMLQARRPHIYRSTANDILAEDAARQEMAERVARQYNLNVEDVLNEAEQVVAEARL